MLLTYISSVTFGAVVREFWIVLFIAYVLFCVIGLFGLELTELSVPSHANLGHSITLYCWFNLDDASLYSVKWYKDEFEFFRFMPNNKPEMQVFPLAGIMLDVSIVSNGKLQ